MWTEDLKKFFMLELKVPEDSPNRDIRIKRDQLDRYVDAYKRGEHPDVVYVLSDPPWSSAPSAGVGPIQVANPVIRRSFADWSYVIRATALQELVGSQSTTGSSSPCPVSCSAERTRLRARVTRYSRNRYTRTTWKFAMPLSKFLLRMRLCKEPIGTAMRRSPLGLRTETVPSPRGARGEEPRTPIEFAHRDLPLEGPWLRWTQEPTRANEREEQDSPSYLLFVGVP